MMMIVRVLFARAPVLGLCFFVSMKAESLGTVWMGNSCSYVFSRAPVGARVACDTYDSESDAAAVGGDER